MRRSAFEADAVVVAVSDAERVSVELAVAVAVAVRVAERATDPVREPVAVCDADRVRVELTVAVVVCDAGRATEAVAVREPVAVRVLVSDCVADPVLDGRGVVVGGTCDDVGVRDGAGEADCDALGDGSAKEIEPITAVGEHKAQGQAQTQATACNPRAFALCE